jgi:hypothetical protein
MKVLLNVKERLEKDLPQCRTRDDVDKLMREAQRELQSSRAPFGQHQQMWLDLKSELSQLSRRPEVINDAHAIIDSLLKRLTT